VISLCHFPSPVAIATTAGARGVLPRTQKLVKLTCNSTVYRPEALMGQSQTLHTRRRKQKSKKHLAKMARRAKKLSEQNAKMAGADALKK